MMQQPVVCPIPKCVFVTDNLILLDNHHTGHLMDYVNRMVTMMEALAENQKAANDTLRLLFEQLRGNR